MSGGRRRRARSGVGGGGGGRSLVVIKEDKVSGPPGGGGEDTGPVCGENRDIRKTKPSTRMPFKSLITVPSLTLFSL